MALLTKIDVHPAGFFITWDDNHESEYSSRYLRGMCGCAVCVSELTGGENSHGRFPESWASR